MSAAILSNNPFSVSRRTFTAENPCKHWRSAETAARCASTWQGSKRLTEPSRGLSRLISSADQWAGAGLWASTGTGLWASAEFSLLLALILSLILVINSLASLCHSRRVLARLDDTFRRCGFVHILAAQFERISAATVCVIQGRHGLNHLVMAQFLTLSSPTVYITQVANIAF